MARPLDDLGESQADGTHAGQRVRGDPVTIPPASTPAVPSAGPSDGLPYGLTCLYDDRMCRNITELRGLEPPKTVRPLRRPEVRDRLGLAPFAS